MHTYYMDICYSGSLTPRSCTQINYYKRSVDFKMIYFLLDTIKVQLNAVNLLQDTDWKLEIG